MVAVGGLAEVLVTYGSVNSLATEVTGCCTTGAAGEEGRGGYGGERGG